MLSGKELLLDSKGTIIKESEIWNQHTRYDRNDNKDKKMNSEL